MARPKSVVPSYRHHVGTGQAVTTITAPNGGHRDIYLGVFGTDASIVEFGRVLIAWKSGQAPADFGAISMNELMVQFLEYAHQYYGAGSKELANFKYAMRPVKELFGGTPAGEFSPKKLKAVRDRMIEKYAWSRKTVNHQIERLRRLIRWAAGEELVGQGVVDALTNVKGLQMGRTDAWEPEPVQPVSDATIKATMPFLTPTVAAMVQVQRWSGARPNEICRLRLVDIDMSRPDVWIYKPPKHKLSYKGIVRSVPLGPKCQAAIRPLMTADQPIELADFFSPTRNFGAF